MFAEYGKIKIQDNKPESAENAKKVWFTIRYTFSLAPRRPAG